MKFKRAIYFITEFCCQTKTTKKPPQKNNNKKPNPSKDILDFYLWFSDVDDMVKDIRTSKRKSAATSSWKNLSDWQ